MIRKDTKWGHHDSANPRAKACPIPLFLERRATRQPQSRPKTRTRCENTTMATSKRSLGIGEKRQDW